MNPTHPQRGELTLIRRLAAHLAGGAGPVVPFGDDMAALDGGRLLWTTDMLMAGVDFDPLQHAPEAVGRKAMAVNLSDCAAVAATPRVALLAVALSNRLTMDEAERLCRGAADCAAEFGCRLVGGDTNSWDQPTVVCVTIAASIDPGHAPVLRSGARPGDRILLTGRVGGSILGRHMTFTPRVNLARAIRDALHPTAMIDISDGLARDLGHILEASRCGAALRSDALHAAIHDDARTLAASTGRDALDHALCDGEDFELIVTVPGGTPESATLALGLLPVGQITEEPGLFMVAPDGFRTPIEPRGWEHFT
jgi:thiamine-monophosphate kinase